MEQYNLNPDVFKEHLIELMFNPSKLDFLAKIGKLFYA
jgi:hypothetical protein